MGAMLDKHYLVSYVWDLLNHGMSKSGVVSRHGFSVICVFLFSLLVACSFSSNSGLIIAIMVFPCLASAWYGGFGSGILATFLATFVSLYCLLPETFSFSLVNSSDRFWLIFLMVNGIIISLIAGSLYASRHHVEKTNTRLDRTLKTLEASEARFRFLVDQTPAVIWTTDKQLNMTSLFGGGKELTVKNREKLADFFANAEEREVGFAAHHRALQGEDVRYEVRVFGHTYTAQVQPLCDGKEIVGVIGLALNISERKKIQQDLERAHAAAEAANEAKSQFLANISHEMRTPLGVVIGYADLAVKNVFSEAQRQRWLGIIQRNARQLNTIINDLLDLSKAEVGHLEIEELQVQFYEFMEDVLSALELEAQAKGIIFEILPTSALPALVLTDPTRLRQILLNVIGNAIKFTEKGKVVVNVFLSSTPNDQRKILHFRVKDTGIGLSAQQKERLFLPFIQADNTMARRFGGSGLGLALSRRLARLLNGDVELLESAPGLGSIFEVTVEAGLPEDQDQKDHAGEVDLPSLAGCRILVVDDMRDVCELVGDILKEVGAAVDFANDGASGVMQALSQVYDAILLDIQMPTLNGYEAARKLREAGIRMPIVAITACAVTNELKNYLSAGFDAYLTKPVDGDALVTLLTSLLQKKQPESSGPG